MKTFKEFTEAPRIPRKKGQPAGSKKHSDLYTDENPKGTIHGLGFKDVKTAEASVKKIEGSGKSHAHKIQAAIAMEQRARVMGKTAEAAVYRRFIEKMKKITKKKNEETESNSQRLTNTKI
jgi:ribosomal protein S13|tara:strand:+ start:98 stop:460 length:363 start_codon:yes stop_codon:yes gene_type:complete